MGSITLKQVTKRFGDVNVIKPLDLHIRDGEFIVFVGPSGCGKSTLLRMIAGLEDTTSGNIDIDGEDATNMPPAKRGLAMVFQSYALYPHMSVRSNIAFPLKRAKVAPAVIDEKIEKAAKMLNLTDYLDRKPGQLSGGQRQRVALARSLVKRPKLLLLDEPLGALDKKLREETQFELMRLQEDLGITFVVVTHDQEEAMTLATRIGVMNNGVIVQTAEPHEVYEHPCNRFVAEFIGNVNLFNGTVVSDERDSATIQCDDINGLIYLNHGISCAPNQAVNVAIRPEKMRITRDVLDEKNNAAEGIITEVAYMGSQSIYKVRLLSGKEIRITQPNTQRDAGERLTWDDHVYLSWDADSSVVLAS